MKKAVLAIASIGLFNLASFAAQAQSVNISALLDKNNDNVSAEKGGHGGGGGHGGPGGGGGHHGGGYGPGPGPGGGGHHGGGYGPGPGYNAPLTVLGLGERQYVSGPSYVECRPGFNSGWQSTWNSGYTVILNPRQTVFIRQSSYVQCNRYHSN
jgi:hypothetical protein